MNIWPQWRKSSYSVGNGACVETATGCGQIHVRDSKDPDGPVLEFSPGAWAKFLDEVKAEPVLTKVPDLSGVPLAELAERKSGATFSSSI